MLLPACTDTGTGDGDTTDADTETTETETTGEVALYYEADIKPIFESACLCHFSSMPGGDMTAPYLNLNVEDALAELVDVDSVQVPGMKRVAPSDPEASYLVHKLRGTHADVGGPADTDPMPPLAPLPDEDIMRIEAWIAAGAAP